MTSPPDHAGHPGADDPAPPRRGALPPGHPTAGALPPGRADPGAALVRSGAVHVLAAGAVVWRSARRRHQVALVHRPRYDDWSFPKGKLNRGESLPADAVREVSEETGHTARLGAALGEVRYEVPEGCKRVRYWAAEARGGSFAPNAETDELRWVAADSAGSQLTYRHDLAVLDRFSALGPPTAVLVLVRHAKAGSRAQWSGADEQRPLSEAGQEQARRLAALLALFGPDRFASVPLLRCEATVAPAAAALGGLPVVAEPLLGEVGFTRDPAGGLERLRALATLPGVTVVCSQGGVIPHVVGALAAEASRPLPMAAGAVPARKGSSWVLTFSGSRLLAADYYPDPTG